MFRCPVELDSPQCPHIELVRTCRWPLWSLSIGGRDFGSALNLSIAWCCGTKCPLSVVTRLQGDANDSGPGCCRDLSGCSPPQDLGTYLVEASVSKAGFSQYC